MKAILHSIVCLCALFMLNACRNNPSNVPYYTVYIRIPITSQYNTFIPDGNIHTLTFTKNTERQRVGYGGVVVWTNIIPEYCAADMTCTKCLNRSHPVEIDGMVATCPLCGETYNLSTFGEPQKGIANQALRSYAVQIGRDASGTVLYIRN